MDALRKQLDALMGANRNGDVREVKRKYYDRDVCRLYLTGLCPHDLFQLTKMDLGPCSKFHSLQLRKEYEEAKAQGKDSYDRELEECLEKHILECDRKIARALKRLEDDDVGAATAIAVSEVTKSSDACEYTRQIKEKLKEAEYLDLEGKTDEKIRILEVVEELRSKRADRQAMSLLEAFSKDRALMPQPLPNPPPLAPLPMMAASAPDARTQELIKQKLKVAEELGEQGRVDEAEKAMEEAEALKKLGSRQDLSADPSKVATQDVRVVQADQKLRVCDICGAFLSIYDSDRRLADHFGGKLHLGYMQIREKLVDLKEQRTRHLNEKDGHDDKGRGRDGQSNSDEQERDWGKVKDQEKDRQGSRVQEPEHQNRGRDKDGDREPEFRRGYLASGRDGDRGRDRKRRREREDDRERDDDGNRHGGRYVDRNYKDRSHTEQGHNRFYRHRTGGYRDGDRDRDGDNRDRDRDRDRWERDRERNREKEKERDRDRAKEKERDRGPVERDRARDRD